MFDPLIDCRFQVRQILPAAVETELAQIQFDESYRAHAAKKFDHLTIKAYDLSAPGANILKQTCLSLGAEAGVHRGAINCTIDREAVLITATRAQLEKLVLKLRPQPFGLKLLSESIIRMLQRQRHLQQKPLEVMAILNITPDSFSDGGRFSNLESVIATADNALQAGADILDIGGESTRPGALLIDEAEELNRIIPVIQALHSTFPQARLSIDTRKASVAKAAIAAGATMINDVSGLTYDPKMASLVASSRCLVILMHSQGTPEMMQENPHYDDVVAEVAEFFYRQIASATAAGVDVKDIILDPGFGFGKTLAHNMELMRRLPELVSLGFPVLVGTSRKSFLTLGDASITPDERETLTAASLAVAVQAGARMLRIHDIKAQMPIVRWLKSLINY